MLCHILFLNAQTEELTRLLLELRELLLELDLRLEPASR